MAKIGIVRIKKLIDGLLLYVEQDYNAKLSAGKVDESFLVRCFDPEEDVVDTIDYTTLAIEIFTRDQFDIRKIDTRLMFDIERASLPTIHVREPAKNKGKQDGIGYIDEEIYENTDSTFSYMRRRSLISNYEFLITSMNRHEVLIMEEVLMALLIGAQDTLALYAPFYTFDFTVKEMMVNNDLVPNPLFIKSIMINASYDKTYPDIQSDPLLSKILFEQKILS